MDMKFFSSSILKEEPIDFNEIEDEMKENIMKIYFKNHLIKYWMLKILLY